MRRSGGKRSSAERAEAAVVHRAAALSFASSALLFLVLAAVQAGKPLQLDANPELGAWVRQRATLAAQLGNYLIFELPPASESSP